MVNLNRHPGLAKTAGRLALRWVALAAFAVWFGGFTFYSAVVIPTLHDLMGDLEAGRVTQEVTNYLNAFGAGAVVSWWGLVAVERRTGGRAARRGRAGLLAVTSAILIGLIALHPVMDARLDSGSLRGFYPLHKVYLIASTAQWFVNLGLLAASVLVWRDPGQMCTDSPSP